MRILRQQNGAALVGVIMTMFVLTLLGTSAFINSAAELKISSNYSRSLEALYAAEAGLQELLAAYRRNPTSFLQKQTGTEMNFPVTDAAQPFSNGTTFWIKELRYDAQTNPDYVEAVICGRNLAKSSMARLRATISCTREGDGGDIPPVFKMGIVTAGQLNVSGPLDIVGTLHANQGFSLSPASEETFKSGQTLITQSLDSLRPDYHQPLEVPKITSPLLENWRTLSRQNGNQIFFGQQNIFLSGDQKGRLIFVDGHVYLTGTNLSGITLVATGSITLNGSTVLNAQGKLDSVFIADGNITLDEFSQISGVFWTNGSFLKLGPGRLKGTVVCQGSINQKEGFQFECFNQIASSFWGAASPSGYSFRLKKWSQI